MRKVLLLVLAIAPFGWAAAAENLGEIVNLEGKVSILKKDTIRKVDAESGMAVGFEDMILTSRDARAKVKLEDGSTVVVDEKSKLKLVSAELFEQSGGRVYYQIVKRGAKGLKVQTEFAIIGVKGTTFLVKDMEDLKSVAMKEGTVGVESPEGEFAHYRKKEGDLAYDEYVTKMLGEYETYKKELQEEFIAYTKEIELGANRSIVIDGKKAVEASVDEKIMKEFEELEQF